MLLLLFMRTNGCRAKLQRAVSLTSPPRRWSLATFMKTMNRENSKFAEDKTYGRIMKIVNPSGVGKRRPVDEYSKKALDSLDDGFVFPIQQLGAHYFPVAILRLPTTRCYIALLLPVFLYLPNKHDYMYSMYSHHRDSKT